MHFDRLKEITNDLVRETGIQNGIGNWDIQIGPVKIVTTSKRYIKSEVAFLGALNHMLWY
jgi:hypothetical protein